MPPQLALLFGCVLVLWLMRLDMKARDAGSWALLIPGILLAIQGSRPLSYWLGLDSGDTISENPIDTIVSVGLVVGALVVIQKRGLNWGNLISRNKALFLIYSYFALSMVWSDLPLLSLKRITKDFGLVLIALVFLTEQDPGQAIRTVFARVSYILFPLSIIMIKWFPAIGRMARNSGDSMFRGLTPHKNTLGQVVFVFSLMLLWDLVQVWQTEAGKQKKMQIYTRIGMLLMGAWLMATCDSQTSLLCLIVGVFIFWAAHRLLRMPNGKKVLISCLVVAACLVTMEKSFGISDMIIRALGRNPSLTGRTNIWHVIEEQKTDPLIGDGFYVFWDTSKGIHVGEELAEIKSTHNGYLEVYVDGGFVGDALLVFLLLVLGSRVIDRLFAEYPLGVMGLVFWILAMIYNLSESSFFRLDTIWFVLLLVTIDYPLNSRRSTAVVDDEEDSVPAKEEANTPDACVVELNRDAAQMRMFIFDTKKLQNSQAETRRNLLHGFRRRLRKRVIYFRAQLHTKSALNQYRRFDVLSCGSVRFLGGSVRFSGVQIGAANRRWPVLRRLDWWFGDKVFPSLALA